MKKLSKILFLLPTLLVAFSLVTPLFAQTLGGGGDITTDEAEKCDDEVCTLDFELDNPLQDDINTVPVLIEKILEIVVVVAVPIITLMIIYTGFLFVQARGNPADIKKAKDALLYTVIGAAIIIGAWTIAQIIGGTVNCLKPGVVC